MDFKAAAGEVLSEVGRPLHYGDITELAPESGYHTSGVRTPQNTMRARFPVDVRDNPETVWTKGVSGVYGLKEMN